MLEVWVSFCLFVGRHRELLGISDLVVMERCLGVWWGHWFVSFRLMVCWTGMGSLGIVWVWYVGSEVCGCT